MQSNQRKFLFQSNRRGFSDYFIFYRTILSFVFSLFFCSVIGLSCFIKAQKSRLLPVVCRFFFVLMHDFYLWLSLDAKAWTAAKSDFVQQLIIDLGQVYNVTRIATQGRPLSPEFVQEYTISYGTNGQDYADYKDSGGNIKVRYGCLVKKFWWR